MTNRTKPVSTADYVDLGKMLDERYVATGDPTKTPEQIQAEMFGMDIGAESQVRLHTTRRPVAAYRDGGVQIAAQLSAGKNPLAKFISELERLSRIGMEPPMIAARLGFTLPQFVESLQRWPENARALEMGRAMGAEDYMMAMHRAGAIVGQTAAINAYLKAKGGFAAPQEHNVTLTYAGTAQSSGPALIDVDRVDNAFARHSALLDEMANGEDG